MPITKVSYVCHVPGHHNSKGELAEWCIKSHETGKIISSHTTKEKAKKHLQDMHAHSGSVKTADASVTETPAFKAWFSGSEVVNPDGTPKVMYHSTQNDIDVFLPYSHFGTLGAANDRYTNLTNFYNNTIKNPSRSHGSQVLPVYLSVKNPLRMVDLASINDNGEVIADLEEEYDEENEEERFKRYPRGWEGEEAVPMTLYEMGIMDIDDFEEHRSNKKAYEFLKQKGYDGIVYKNVIEDAGEDSWIVFNSNQIKSAIGNRGSFDQQDNSIIASAKIAVYVEEQWEDILQKKGYIKDETTETAWEDTLYINPSIPDVRVLLNESNDSHYIVELNGDTVVHDTDPEVLWDTLDEIPELYRKSIKHDREFNDTDKKFLQEIGVTTKNGNKLLGKQLPKLSFRFKAQTARQYDYESHGSNVVLISPANTTKVLQGDEATDFWVAVDHIENQTIEDSQEEYLNRIQDLIRPYFERDVKKVSKKCVVQVDATRLKKGSVTFISGVEYKSGQLDKLKFTTNQEKAAKFPWHQAIKIKSQLGDFQLGGVVKEV